jgi:hypothetical protein
MFMNLDEFLRFLKVQKMKADFSAWSQVGVMSPQEKLRHKALLNNNLHKVREIEMLVKKAMNLQGQVEVARDEFWNDLYNKHGLPPEGNYHITDDSRILMEPKK